MIISMAAGGNVLEFGEGIRERMHQIEANLPIGIKTHLVANQAVVVEEAVAGFTKALGRRWSSSWRSASSAWACAPGSWSPSPSRWCWR